DCFRAVARDFDFDLHESDLPDLLEAKAAIFDRLVDENGDLVYTPGKGTDIEAIVQGHIAVTPLQMDQTQSDMAAELATIFE
ncbi:MAG: hypothetical protein ACPHDV_06955, partial [Parvibaculales bacterium]